MKLTPDVVIFQETKRREVDRRLVKSEWSSRRIDWVVLDGIRSSGYLNHVKRGFAIVEGCCPR